MMYYISHSAKGSTWKNHEYIKVVNGVYYYAKDKAMGTIKDALGEKDRVEYEKAKKKYKDALRTENMSKPDSNLARSAARSLNDKNNEKRRALFIRDRSKYNRDDSEYRASKSKYQKEANNYTKAVGKKNEALREMNKAKEKYEKTPIGTLDKLRKKGKKYIDDLLRIEWSDNFQKNK